MNSLTDCGKYLSPLYLQCVKSVTFDSLVNLWVMMFLRQGLHITVFDFLETFNYVYIFFQIGVFDARNMNSVIPDDIQYS